MSEPVRNIRVRLLTGSFGRVEDGAHVIYKSGSEPFLVSQAEFEEHGKQLEFVGAAGAGLATRSLATETGSEPTDHWRAAVSQVRALGDVDEVRAFLAAEEAGKARDSVIEAAEARIKELGG
jgi:hypothetical protein